MEKDFSSIAETDRKLAGQFYYRGKPVPVSPFAAQMFYKLPAEKKMEKSFSQGFYYRQSERP